jgi:transposase
MPRLPLRDDQWVRIEPLLHGKAGDRGRTGADNRLFVEAMLWMARTGAPWRDLVDGAHYTISPAPHMSPAADHCYSG